MSSIPIVLALGSDRSKPIAANRIRLLEEIMAQGSIVKAAELASMSYRSALNALEDLEQLSGQQLLIKMVGGKQGGGAQLTEAGQKLLTTYRLIENFQRDLLSKIGEHTDTLHTYNKMMFKTSARNQLQGTVLSIKPHAEWTDLVTVRISDQDSLNVILSKDSVLELGLSAQASVSLLVKAPNIRPAETLAVEEDVEVNQLMVQVQQVQLGRLQSKLALQLAGEISLSAIVETEWVNKAQIVEGVMVPIVIQAQDVIVGIALGFS